MRFFFKLIYKRLLGTSPQFLALTKGDDIPIFMLMLAHSENTLKSAPLADIGDIMSLQRLHLPLVENIPLTKV